MKQYRKYVTVLIYIILYINSYAIQLLLANSFYINILQVSLPSNFSRSIIWYRSTFEWIGFEVTKVFKIIGLMYIQLFSRVTSTWLTPFSTIVNISCFLFQRPLVIRQISQIRWQRTGYQLTNYCQLVIIEICDDWPLIGCID